MAVASIKTTCTTIFFIGYIFQSLVKRSQKIATPNTQESQVQSQVFPNSFSFRFNSASNGTVLNDLSADDVHHYERCADYTGLDHHAKDYHVYSKPDLQTEESHVYSKPEY